MVEHGNENGRADGRARKHPSNVFTWKENGDGYGRARKLPANVFTWKENGGAHGYNASEYPNTYNTLIALIVDIKDISLYCEITMLSDFIERSTTRSPCVHVKVLHTWDVSQR